MGKVKGWLMSMEEDALWMSRDSWIARHGTWHMSVYDDVQENLKKDENAMQRLAAEAKADMMASIQRLDDILHGRV